MANKVNPIMKAALKILKKAGIDAYPDSAMELRVASREYNPRPMYISLRSSQHNDSLARFEVCHLYSDHTEYRKCATLHRVEFNY